MIEEDKEYISSWAWKIAKEPDDLLWARKQASSMGRCVPWTLFLVTIKAIRCIRNYCQFPEDHVNRFLVEGVERVGKAEGTQYG